MLKAYIPDRAVDFFVKWFKRYRDDLRDCLDEEVPRWQGAPKSWPVPPPAAVRTETVVGARLAKQEKTRRVIHAGKQYDVELGYCERQAAHDDPSVRPPCEQQSAIPMDTRLLKMLVFLFDVEQMHDPPDHALYDGTLERGPQGTDWLWEAGPAVIVWDKELPPDYWERLRHSKRTIITVTQRDNPADPWFSVGAGAAGRAEYPVTCRWHQCMKILTVSPTNVHLHAPEPIQPEVLDAVEEVLREQMSEGSPAEIRYFG